MEATTAHQMISEGISYCVKIRLLKSLLQKGQKTCLIERQGFNLH